MLWTESHLKHLAPIRSVCKHQWSVLEVPPLQVWMEQPTSRVPSKTSVPRTDACLKAKGGHTLDFANLTKKKTKTLPFLQTFLVYSGVFMPKTLVGVVYMRIYYMCTYITVASYCRYLYISEDQA